MQKTAWIAAALFGATGVITGAFGAHALESMLEASGRVETFETGVRYQLIHALFLLFLGFLAEKKPSKLLKASIIFTITGIIIFSFSLYLLCLLDLPKLGMITPLGGLGMILGWVLLLIHLIKNKSA